MPALIGKQIILLYHNHDHDCVEILLENRSHGLPRPLDLVVNCRSSATTVCCARNPVSPRLSLAAPFPRKNQTRRSATHETKLPCLLRLHQGALGSDLALKEIM
ncbi:hypothetical protein DFAR_3470005 [Desulfarculales bacterium]